MTSLPALLVCISLVAGGCTVVEKRVRPIDQRAISEELARKLPPLVFRCSSRPRGHNQAESSRATRAALLG